TITAHVVFPGTTAWIFGRDEFASVPTDENGCYEMDGRPRDTPLIAALAQEQLLSGFGMMSPLSRDSPESFNAELISTDLISLIRQLIRFGGDGRHGLLMDIRVCEFPKHFAVPTNTVCVGLQHVRATLDSGSPPTDCAPRNLPNDALTETEGPDIMFIDIPAGEPFVTRDAPDGETLDCHLDE